MVSTSDANQRLTKKIKNSLIAEFTHKENVENIEYKPPIVTYSELFSKEFRNLTLIICLNLLFVSIVYFGMLYILPQIIEKREHNSFKANLNDSIDVVNHLSDESFIQLIVSALIEIPSALLMAILAGYSRLKSIGMGYIFSFIFLSLTLIFNDFFSVGIAAMKFFIMIPDILLTVYSCEAFPTKIRSLGIGVTSSVYRLGCILTPLINQILFDIHYNLPLYLFLISSLFGFILTLFSPFDTTNRNIG
jgi:hypothetical protein